MSGNDRLVEDDQPREEQAAAEAAAAEQYRQPYSEVRNNTLHCPALHHQCVFHRSVSRQLISSQILHFPQQRLFSHQTTEVEEPLLDVELKAEDRVSPPVSSPEQITEDPLPEAANTQKQEATSLHSSPEPEPAAEIKDESGAIDLQDDTPDR